MQTIDHSLPLLAKAFETLDVDERSEFDHLVREHLGPLMRYIEFELGNLRDTGLIDEQTVSVEEVIDKTLVRALEDLPSRMQVTPISSWLTGLASMTLAHEIERARDVKQSDMHRIALRQSRRHKQLLKSAGAQSAGEDQQADVPKELGAYLIDVLADLPTRWRRAVIFAYMDDWSESEIADVLKLKDSEEVEQVLGHANAFLRARLAEDALPDMDWPGSSLRWPEMRDGMTDNLELDLSRAAE